MHRFLLCSIFLREGGLLFLLHYLLLLVYTLYFNAKRGKGKILKAFCTYHIYSIKCRGTLLIFVALHVALIQGRCSNVYDPNGSSITRDFRKISAHSIREAFSKHICLKYDVLIQCGAYSGGSIYSSKYGNDRQSLFFI